MIFCTRLCLDKGCLVLVGVPEFSIVVPVYNEEDGVETFADNLRSVLSAANISYEVFLINDGSTDSTSERLHAISHKWLNLFSV